MAPSQTSSRQRLHSETFAAQIFGRFDARSRDHVVAQAIGKGANDF
jgi:hypothetical protein